MSTLKRAIEIAFEAHKDQKDKNGEPYIGHVLRVMNMGRTENEKICGVLHDLVEDTEWTFEDLRREGFSKTVIDALTCVTKTSEDEDYDKFIERIEKNRLAVIVKINDLSDNMDVRRFDVIREKDIQRLNKYLRAYRRLTQNLSENTDY
ncbi:MAG: phosphohydrolase [Ignavibacteria bacterium]|nr:phosphohydrolase [Ignavibacteria bacterium]MBK9227340.1 phosphohydrolase [Ignavibacteria bacterium]